jgi:hypothetical protein
MKTYLITFFANNSRLLQTTYIRAVDRLSALKEFRNLYRDVEIFDLRAESS